jgi:hypothetical protein
MSRRSRAPDAHVELRSRNESVGAAGKHGTIVGMYTDTRAHGTEPDAVQLHLHRGIGWGLYGTATTVVLVIVLAGAASNLSSGRLVMGAVIAVVGLPVAGDRRGIGVGQRPVVGRLQGIDRPGSQYATCCGPVDPGGAQRSEPPASDRWLAAAK